MAEQINYIVSIKVMAETDKFTQGMGNVNTSLSGVNQTLGRITRSFASFAAIFVARELLQGIGRTVSETANLSLQFAIVKRTADLSSGSLEQLKKNLWDLSTSLGASIEDLSGVALAAGRAGIESTQAMTSISETAIKLSRISGMELGQAGNALIRFTKLFPLSADQVASSIAFMGKKVLGSEEDIVQAVNRMIAGGKTLGMSFSDMVTLAGFSIEVAGGRVARVGTELNTSFFQLASNVEKAARLLGMSRDEFRKIVDANPTDALVLIAEAFSKIESNTERAVKIQSIFGAVGAKVLGPLVDGWEKFKALQQETNDITQKGTYITEAYGEISSEVALSIQRFHAANKEFAQFMARYWIPTVGTATEYWSNFLKAYREGGVRGMFMDWAGGELAQLEKKVKSFNDLIVDADRRSANRRRAARETTEKRKEPGIDLDAIDLGISGPDKKDILTAETQKILDNEATKIQALKDMWDAYHNEETAKKLAMMEADTAQYQFAIDTMKQANMSLWTIAGTLRDTFSAGVSSMFMDMIKGTFDAKKAFTALGMEMIAVLVKFMVEKAIAFMISKALLALELAGIIAFGKASAAALAAPAAMMSTISYGGAALAGGIALADAVGSAKLMAVTMAQGGIVPGMGNRDSVPALLTPGEMVIPREQVRNFNNSPTVNISMAGALVMDDPVAVQRLYRNYLRDAIRTDIKAGRDVFYG